MNNFKVEIAIYESDINSSPGSKLLGTPSLPSDQELKDSYASNSNKNDEDNMMQNDSETKANSIQIFVFKTA